MTGPGTFSELNSAGKQKNWFEQMAGRGSSWVGSAQDLADATSPPEIAVATVSSRAEILQTIASPGKALTSNGLGFLVSLVMSPFVELAEWAIGDPEQMRATGDGWAKVGSWLDQVAEAERRRAAATEAIWQGQAATAFRTQMTEFADAVAGLGDDVRELKDILDTIADLFDMLVEFIIETVTELVIGLIVQWLAALAASWATGGVSVGGAVAVTTARVAKAAGSVAARIAALQKKLRSLVIRLEGLLAKLRGSGGIRQVLGEMSRRRNGNFAERALVGMADKRSRVGRIISNADTTSFASTTANRFLPNTTGPTALAANISESILSSMVGGTTRLGKAATNAGIAVGTDTAIEKGAEAIYDKATEPRKSLDERRADQVRGFSPNPTAGGNA